MLINFTMFHDQACIALAKGTFECSPAQDTYKGILKMSRMILFVSCK